MLLQHELVILGSLSALAVWCAVPAGAAQRQRVQRFVRYEAGGQTAYGLVEGDRVRRLDGDLFGQWRATDQTLPLDDVTILTPTAPSKVIALAGNYRDHLGDTPVPDHPEPFFKLPSCLQRHEGPIVQPKSHEPVHHEGELVVVIGKRAKNVPPDEAMDYVFGVTCGNDISARYWQQHDRQWWRAKACDTFGPCGPFIARGLDYGALDLVVRVNGEVRQQSNTRHMIHNIAQTVSFISRHITLEPGDLIFTGTPGTTTPLQIGDVVEVDIAGVGVLRNRVVAEP